MAITRNCNNLVRLEDLKGIDGQWDYSFNGMGRGPATKEEVFTPERKDAAVRITSTGYYFEHGLDSYDWNYKRNGLPNGSKPPHVRN